MLEKPESKCEKSHGRVLLLDDDVSFNQIITDFLTESGYTVVSVQGGGDGIREVLAGDFAVILCDMVMPTLSGDMFYRAVERVRPHLCSRFIFMTGHRCDEKINDFIHGINAIGLRKPFHLDDLLCTIRLLQMCGRFTETSTVAAIAVTSPAPAAAPILPMEEPVLRNLVPLAFETETRQRSAVVPRPLVVPLEPAADEAPSPGAESWSIFQWGNIVFLAAILALVPVCRYFFLVKNAEASSANLSLLQWQAEHAAKMVQDGKDGRRGLEEMARVPEKIAAERNALKWTSALWIVSGATRSGIELTGLDLRGPKDSATIPVLRVNGIATANGPQKIAEQFRAELEAKLRPQFDKWTTAARFERLDAEARPSAKFPGQSTSAFSIVVTFMPRAEAQLSSRKITEHAR